ncbi:MAG TPA: TetR/AcrR family transcriptional regulator [Candidatus Dormibacteraeota bacterium]
MSSQTRKYTLKRRADSQSETRRRIVEATAALHDEVGPARTTVAEIARRAGVQRLTVYNHFPDEAELFAACGDHWMAQNPPPDPTAALLIEDAVERVRAVLGPVYRWYRANARMNEHLQRDRLLMPSLDAAMRIRLEHVFLALGEALVAGFSPPPRSAQRVRAAVSLALDFWTWRRLANQGLSDDDAASLMVDAVKAACVAQG